MNAASVFVPLIGVARRAGARSASGFALPRETLGTAMGARRCYARVAMSPVIRAVLARSAAFPRRLRGRRDAH